MNTFFFTSLGTKAISVMTPSKWAVPICFLVVFAFLPAALTAEELIHGDDGEMPKGVQMGEIKLEAAKKKRNPYKLTQENTIAYFDELSLELKKLSGSGSGTIKSLEDDVLNHLTATYLYCSIKYGSCPFVLEAILETDVIRSRLAGKASCSNMKSFWKKWISNDMHKRIQFMIPIGFSHKKTQFNQKERPKFVKCKPTILEAISGGGTNKQYFSDRYAEDSKVVGSVRKTNLLLQTIKKKIPNIFTATQSG